MTDAKPESESSARDSIKRLPDFELAELRSVNPCEVVDKTGSDSLKEFLLMIALVFNDLKDYLWWGRQLHKEPPDDGECTPYAGQWRGMQLHIYRQVCGLLHELFKVLVGAHEVIAGEEMQSVLSTLSDEHRVMWRELWCIANSRPQKDAEGRTPEHSEDNGDARFTSALADVRHNLVFHYGQPKRLVRGFRLAFFESQGVPEYEQALYSKGKDAQETRFYYADAAVEKAFAHIARGDVEGFHERVNRAAIQVNDLLASILEIYLRDKQEKRE